MVLRSQSVPFEEIRPNTKIRFAKISSSDGVTPITAKRDEEGFMAGVIEESKKITLGGKQADFYSINPEGSDSVMEIVRFTSESQYFEIICNVAGGGAPQRFANIISSFKFTQ